MGCCCSRDQSSLADSEELDGQITLGKSRPLLQERIKWKSDVPITEGQLKSKRDEFWETAPAFEGRKEIWDALRAASAQAEQGDWALAQAIIEGANVVLPDGTLRDSYDELGNRYQVPIYCLFNPINLIEQKSESSVTSASGTQPQDNLNASQLPSDGALITLKLRLSTSGDDYKVEAKTTETVASVKRRILCNMAPKLFQTTDIHDLRMYYGGRFLGDKMKIEECNVPSGFVIQVIIRSAEDCLVVKTSGDAGRSNNNNNNNNGKSTDNVNNNNDPTPSSSSSNHHQKKKKRSKHHHHHNHGNNSNKQSSNNNQNSSAATIDQQQNIQQQNSQQSAAKHPTTNSAISASSENNLNESPHLIPDTPPINVDDNDDNNVNHQHNNNKTSSKQDSKTATSSSTTTAGKTTTSSTTPKSESIAMRQLSSAHSSSTITTASNVTTSEPPPVQ